MILSWYSHSFFAQTPWRFNRYSNQELVSNDPYASARQSTFHWQGKQKNSKKTTSLIEGALQETLSAKITIGKGFLSDLMQTALQDSLSAETLVVIGFDTQLNKTALQDIIDFIDLGEVKSVPDVLKKLIDQKKGVQHGQMLFYPGAL